VTESRDLVAALLAAEPGVREELLRSAETSELEAALAQLGHTRQAAAAEVLALADVVVESRELRKTARRELHRLRSMGIEAPAVHTALEPTRPRSAAPLEAGEASATEVDPSGSRGLWLVADRPLGGMWFSALLLNDTRGLQELSLIDTTRKRFTRDLDEMRKGAGTWVSLPGRYALALVREAVDLTREVGGGLPTRYPAFRDVFGEAPGPPERALVFETVSPLEVNFNPEWLDESVRLGSEPEVNGWYVQLPSELRSRALDVARSPAAGLLVPGRTPEQQAMQLLADAAQQALTPVVRRAVRRRLEETAYIFVATDRLNAARWAVAAAMALDNARLPVERQPWLRRLLAAGMVRLVGAEMVGTRHAAEVLIDLIERASQRDAQAGPGETLPSGLILPR
jgi:hypothetical protein